MKKFLVIFIFCTLGFSFFAEDKNTLRSFSAEIKGSSVFLSWELEQQNTPLLLYRSLNPFVNLSSIAEAVLLASFSSDTKSFIDSPPTNRNYYYALIFVDEINSDTVIRFVPGKNTLAGSLRLTEQTEASPIADREISLPLLNSDKLAKTRRIQFSVETENKIKNLEERFRKYNGYMTELKASKKITGEFFRFAQESPEKPDVASLSLKRILDRYEAEKNWTGLEREITKFLQLSHSEAIGMRAQFYRAEALFFQEQYDQALLQFLQVENFYEPESKNFIKACLDMLGKIQQ